MEISGLGPTHWNRGDGNLAPSRKLNPCSGSQTLKEEKDEIDWWTRVCKKINDKKTKIKDNKTLKTYLLKASCCDVSWLDIDENLCQNIRQTTNARPIINCILKRNIKICEEWYDNLHIESLIPNIPEERNNLFGPLLKNCWRTVDREEGKKSFNVGY